jgi:hypothetical protein
MSIAPLNFLLALLLFTAAQSQQVIMPISTSDAVDVARIIARDEGYDVTNTKVYYFDLLTNSEGKPFLQGYTAIGFYIDGQERNLITINNATGQAIDYNTCEIFAYPDLKSFQDNMIRVNKAKKKTPQELARDVGCGSPQVLTQPISKAKRE